MWFQSYPYKNVSPRLINIMVQSFCLLLIFLLVIVLSYYISYIPYCIISDFILLCGWLWTVQFSNNFRCLKVWSTVKIRGTLVPQNAIVPVARPRLYSIIILNTHFIPKALLRASSQITASSYVLERHL